ncbi:MAG: anthranilate synthase component I, partial [Ketobacter sp.]
MTLEKFNTLSEQGFNRIPLMREALADMETPLSTYKKLADQPFTYLFESVQGGEKWGRYSFIGLPCRTCVTVNNRDVVIRKDGEIQEQLQAEDPLAFVE